MRDSAPVVSTLAAMPWGGAIVLRYHSVNDEPRWSGDYMQPSLTLPVDAFERQVAMLAERYRVVPIGEIASAIAEGGSPDPRSVAITFDDGYEDNYRCAYPVLRRHGVCAAFYVTTGCVNDERMLWTVRLRLAIRRTERNELACAALGNASVDLSSDGARERAIRFVTGLVKRCSRDQADALLHDVFDALDAPERGDLRVLASWDELREMRNAGMTIGSHTVGHYNSTSLDDEELALELGGSKEALERELGLEEMHFAYPNGRTDAHCDSRTARLVREAGYSSAVTSVAGPASGRYSAFAIPRLGVPARFGDVRLLEAHLQYTRLGRPDGRSVVDVARDERTRPGAAR